LAWRERLLIGRPVDYNAAGMKGLWAWFLGCAIPLAGCGPVPLYAPSAGGYLGPSITPRRRWVLSGTLAGPALAVDGDLLTAARAARDQLGAHLIIDLKEPCVFQSVIIDHGAAAGGHCRLVALDTSVDGTRWRRRYAAAGTRRVTVLCLPEVVLARYVRLRCVVPGPGRWTIAEVYLQ